MPATMLCFDLGEGKRSPKMKQVFWFLGVSEMNCLKLGIERMEAEVRRQSYYYEASQGHLFLAKAIT